MFPLPVVLLHKRERAPLAALLLPVVLVFERDDRRYGRIGATVCCSRARREPMAVLFVACDVAKKRERSIGRVIARR